MSDKDFLHNQLNEGNRDEIGIKLAKDLEEIDDERVLWQARLDTREKMLEDHRQIIYYLANKLYDEKLASVEGYFQGTDREPHLIEIEKPRNKSLHHVEVRFEV